jgi:phospho-N-acetylmuramoyl-pentapeptide-transferase
MGTSTGLPLILSLTIFSFSITGILIVPFINLLFKLRALRPKEAPKKGAIPLFDKLHDKKAGTPLGGGVLLIALVTLFFLMIFPFASHMGVAIRSAYNFRWESFIILFTFLAFGLLGMFDDYIKIFGQPKAGHLGKVFGLSRRAKFILQWVVALIVSGMMYFILGVKILHIPLIGITFNLGLFYIPFAAFVIVSFTNAYNITDGLDGLASGLLAICIVAFGIIAANSLDTPLAIFSALWLGSLMAFLYFNIWPARIFLGDAGALSFGATLAVIGLLTGSIFALLIIGGVFIIEILSSAVQILGWKYLKKPILPLAPLHNTYLSMGWEEPKIVVRAWLFGIMLAAFGLWLATI